MRDESGFAIGMAFFLFSHHTLLLNIQPGRGSMDCTYIHTPILP